MLELNNEGIILYSMLYIGCFYRMWQYTYIKINKCQKLLINLKYLITYYLYITYDVHMTNLFFF